MATDTATERIVGLTPLTIHRRARWGECDPAGVVHTVSYAGYVASAFELFMETAMPDNWPSEKRMRGLATPAKALHLALDAPLRPGETFAMTIGVAQIRTRSFDLDVAGRTLDGGGIFQAGLTVLTIDAARRTATALPDMLREVLERHRAGRA